ncbi:long-chain specific acyl-CoA dehydrogenase, mitochondrial-like [Antedon mediterranea]|uniref:long-chain specific acyl-CoA dehydrogenase, mitochondrial-like n=1 Tax=Antedon mediterranea TaxID=105859 RepID=UPI003AF5DD91
MLECPKVQQFQKYHGLNIIFYCRNYTSHRPVTSCSPRLTDFDTRAIFNEEHDNFRQKARQFFNSLVANQRRWELQGKIETDVWRQLGNAGLLCVTIPKEYGAIGADFKTSVIVWEEQMYSNGVGTAFPIHSDIVGTYISDLGTKEQKERILPKMVTGEMIGCIAMTEPQAGSDLQGIRTSAVKDGNDWILNGSKVFISNGYLANVSLVVAITDPNAKSLAHGISLFLVERGMEGYTRGQPLQKLGQKAVDTCELFFDDVRLPPSALLGQEHKGFYHLMQQLPRERMLVGCLALAHSEYIFEQTRDFLKLNGSLFESQEIQHKLAEFKTDICVGRSFADQCIQLFEEGRLSSSSASMLKYWCTDLTNKIVNECVQQHGQSGCMADNNVARAFVDSRIQSIYGGSNEIMKELIARDIVSKK